MQINLNSKTSSQNTPRRYWESVHLGEYSTANPLVNDMSSRIDELEKSLEKVLAHEDSAESSKS
jgi:hypothetical protein